MRGDDLAIVLDLSWPYKRQVDVYHGILEAAGERGWKHSLVPIAEGLPWEESGEIKWSNIAKNFCGERENCDPGISAAVTAIPGVVFAGHMDGSLRAYGSETGEVLWETDTDRAYETISGAEAHVDPLAAAARRSLRMGTCT